MERQFSTRADVFNDSANWVTDPYLIATHVRLAGSPQGKGLDLCCGTGIIGRALAENDWQMTGVDITLKMADRAGKHFPVAQGSASALPFETNAFDLVVMRQALFLLDAEKVMEEVRRVLKGKGTFILSQTVPFSKEDAPWLRKIHFFKQAQMLEFYTSDDLEYELIKQGFTIVERDSARVRESITKWMRAAPELNEEKKRKVCGLIRYAPEDYRRTRHVEDLDGELHEDWNWVIFRAKKRSKVKKCHNEKKKQSHL